MEDDTYPKKVWQTRQEENVRHPKNLGKGIQKMIKGKEIECNTARFKRSMFVTTINCYAGDEKIKWYSNHVN